MNMRCNVNQLTLPLLLILTLACVVPLARAVGWSSDIRLTADPGWDLTPSIIQTKNGLIWVLWSSDRVALQDDLYYKTSSDYGLTWSSEIRLTTDPGNDNMPSLIQTADGSIWVVWSSDRTGENCHLFYMNSSDYGLTWSSDTQLTTDSCRDVWPSITQDTRGTIWVVWSSNRTVGYDLFYKTSSDYGLTWSSEIQLTTDPDFDDGPSIIQALDGSIWVVWQSNRGRQYDLYYKTSSDYGLTWSSEIQLTTDTGDDLRPSITCTDQRRIWVVWETPRTGEPDPNFEIFYKFSDVIPLHDVAITNVQPSATNVTAGDIVTVSVVAENQGSENEIFDVKCYANSTLVGSQTITLTPGASQTLNFPWTTPYRTATYIISANATTVPGETLPSTADNTFIDGTVKVVKPPPQGDINGDGHVDLQDLYLVLIAYGTKAGDPGYNPNADINKDGVVNLNDLYYVLRDYGE